MIEEKVRLLQYTTGLFKQTEIMFLRLVNTIILVLFAGLVSYAQNIRITVLDKDNQQPVSLAFVNIYGAGNSLQQTEQTDVNGIANLSLTSYPCTIEIVMQGYEKQKKYYETAPVNTNPVINITKKFGSLNEVVVTGLGQPTKAKNALSNYQVITKAQIQSQGAVTLDQALRNQPNISLSTDQVLGTTAVVQGMRADKLKILIDGMPVNGRENGNINMSQINMNNVERIELIQGPMSVVYGTDAVAGVINIITKREHKKLSGTVNTYLESVGKYNADASITFKLKERNQFTLGGGRNFFGGYLNIDNPVTYGGDTLRTQRSYFFKPVEQYIGNFAYQYTTPSLFKIRFASDYLNEKITSKGSLQTWDPWSCYAFDEYFYTTRSLNRLSVGGNLGKNGKWQSDNSYNIYNRIRNRFKKDMVTLQQDPVNEPGMNDTTFFRNVTMRGSYINSLKKLQYTVGYDVNMEFGKSRKVDSGYTRNIQDYALFANVSYPVVKDMFTIQAGSRVAYNTAYTPPVIPSINLLLTPLKNLQVRASYTQGFRAPTLKEMYLTFIDNNHHITGNSNLKAEKSNNVQLSASYQVYEKKADYLQLMLSSSYNDISNGISLVNLIPGTNYYTYANIDHLSNLINTLQIDGQAGDFHGQISASYNYTFGQNGSYNAFSALEGSANLQYAFTKIQTNLNLFYRYSSTQPFLDYNDDGTAKYAGKQNELQLIDVTAEKKLFAGKVRVIAGFKNITNVLVRQTSNLIGSPGTHGSTSTSTAGPLMPRSFFTSLHFTID